MRFDNLILISTLLHMLLFTWPRQSALPVHGSSIISISDILDYILVFTVKMDRCEGETWDI